MAGPVSDRSSFRDSRNPRKNEYDVNGMARPSGVVYRGQRAQLLTEEIITEGDRQLQELMKKQSNTRVSLDSFLTQKKNFSEATISHSMLNDVSGTLTLDNYGRCVQNSEELDELRQAGLTEDEIILKLESDKNSARQFQPKKKIRLGVDPLVTAERLREINRKLAEHKSRLQRPTRFAGAKVMSRQERDLELAITKNREKGKQFSCLLTDGCKSKIVDPNHPINHLGEILEKISSRSIGDAKRRKIGDDLAGKVKVNHSRGETKFMSSKSDCESEKDSDSDDGVAPENFDVPNRPTGEQPSNILLPDGTMAIQGNVESIPEDVIRRFRLSLDEIRALPRFKNYTPGEPSQTIYLKNLSSRVSEIDLVALFKRFQKADEPKIVFRLLKGKMRGQAFVRFNSIETAKEALNLVNGYNFKGKPIVIEFGKQGTSVPSSKAPQPQSD